jgi:ABC-type lipoprotein release transport system permease subunit
LITVSAVILAVMLSTLTSSMQEGTYARMIDNMVKFYTGYIQIHHPDYWESKSINDTYQPDSLLQATIESIIEIELAVPRLESFTLVSSGVNTKGCSLIGIDPEKEDSLTGLSKWIKQGKYLEKNSKGVIIAINIAKNLGIGIGDTLILISQGYQGSSASALMPVLGILEFPSPQLNNFASYIDLRQAGEFFGASGRITSMSLMVKDYQVVKKTAQALNQKLTPAYSVKTWDEMQPELVNMIEGDRAGAVIMKGILYLVVGFGILGTIIMMLVERKKEMGVMVAIGMQKYRLQGILTYETFYMGILGVIAGTLLSIPVILYFVGNPLPLTGETGTIYESFGIEPALFFSISPFIFINQAITILVITMMISIYPLLTVSGMQVIKAIRGQ